jgi:hypothetical protein
VAAAAAEDARGELLMPPGHGPAAGLARLPAGLLHQLHQVGPLESPWVAAGFGVLLLFIAAAPYRRGDVWAWWGVLAGMLTVVLLILARVPVLGVRTGSGTALVMLGVVGLALLLDVGRLRRAVGS